MKDDQEAKGWAERTINKVAKIAISRLIEAERIDVSVKTTLSQAMRGEIEAIFINLDGFLARENLRIETFQLQINSVAVITKLAAQGKIQLVQPSTGELILTLRQHQLNAFLEAVLINQKKHPSNLAENSAQDYRIHQLKTTFLAENQLQIVLDWATVATESIQSSTLCVVPTLIPEEEAIQLVVQSPSGQEVPTELLTKILVPIEEILSLQDFKQRGTSFQIQQFELTENNLILRAAATIHQFPSR